jgi:hypothetical protein
VFSVQEKRSSMRRTYFLPSSHHSVDVLPAASLPRLAALNGGEKLIADSSKLIAEDSKRCTPEPLNPEPLNLIS